MEIRIATKKDEQDWDSVVGGSPSGTLFHRLACLRVMEKHSRMRTFGRSAGSKLLPLIGYRGDDPVAVFPLFVYGGFFRAVFSPPLGTAVTRLGPAMKDHGEYKQHKRETLYEGFIRSVNEYLRREYSPFLIHVRSSPGLEDPRPFMWSGYSVKPMYDYSIDLSPGPDKILDGWPKALGRNIRRCENKGLKFVEGAGKDLRYVLDSVSRRYGEQDMSFGISHEYLRDMYRACGGGMKVFLVRYRGRTVGGNLTISRGGRLSLWMGSARQADAENSANDFLLWETVKWACSKGFRELENIWANTERLCRYKSKFNPGLLMSFSAEKNSNLCGAVKYFKGALGLNKGKG